MKKTKTMKKTKVQPTSDLINKACVLAEQGRHGELMDHITHIRNTSYEEGYQTGYNVALMGDMGDTSNIDILSLEETEKMFHAVCNMLDFACPTNYSAVFAGDKFIIFYHNKN